jgi:PAS domain S-box-containing protein
LILLLLLLLVLLALAAGYAIAWRRAVRGYSQISALLLGLRDGDYALRAAPARGAAGAAFAALNALADGLMGDRRAGIESDALLGKLLGAVDLAIIILGPRGVIVSGNGAAGAIFGREPEVLAGLRPEALGIGEWVDAVLPARFETRLAGGAGPWDVRRVQFRRGGRKHVMLVASDLSRALREEERRVWRGLIRVLSHETGNSLGPIQATAEAMGAGLENMAIEDVRAGLQLIERRTRGLAGFIRRYAELARLPLPVPERVEFGALLRRVSALEIRVVVTTEIGSDPVIAADAVQLEQALINLIRNAADAARETGGGVLVRLTESEAALVVEIIDDGFGLPRSENIFVPGFTTKTGGSGIGLVLAREIVEAHGGRLELADRDDARGAVVKVKLPFKQGLLFLKNEAKNF